MKFRTPKNATICLKLEAKRQPLRDTKNWNFKPCQIQRAIQRNHWIRTARGGGGV